MVEGNGIRRVLVEVFGILHAQREMHHVAANCASRAFDDQTFDTGGRRG